MTTFQSNFPPGLAVCPPVASNILPQAQLVAASYQNTEAKILDVSSEKELGSLIDESELVLRSVGWWQSGRKG